MTFSADHRLFVLLVALACLTTATPASAQTRQTKEAQRALDAFNKAYQAKDWPQAIDHGVTFNGLMPDQAVMQYNLACVYSLNGDVDLAVQWLAKSVANGLGQPDHIEADPDLDNIRTHPGYLAAMDTAKDHHAKLYAELKRQFQERSPVVYAPLDYDKSVAYPLIIALHGYGGRADGFPMLWRDTAAQAGAILVLPQAVRSVQGAGYNWGKIDEADYLVKLTLESALKQYHIDEQRIILTGFSQGGFIAYSVAVRHPEKFIGVIPMGAPYWPSVDAPPRANGQRLPRFYFMCGARDRLLKETRQAAEDFAAAGYETKLHIYPGVGHAFPRDRDRELREALKFVLRE